MPCMGEFFAAQDEKLSCSITSRVIEAAPCRDHISAISPEEGR
jgi:hypothetical protein